MVSGKDLNLNCKATSTLSLLLFFFSWFASFFLLYTRFLWLHIHEVEFQFQERDSYLPSLDQVQTPGKSSLNGLTGTGVTLLPELSKYTK